MQNELVEKLEEEYQESLRGLQRDINCLVETVPKIFFLKTRTEP